MKKAVLLIGLVSFFVLVCGCSNSQYAIEKKYWHIKKQADTIFNNPYASPPKELEKAVVLLDNFIKRYPKNKLALDAEFTVGRLYIAKKEYNKARERLKSVVSKYSAFQPVCADATFLIGNSYEIEDRWDSALAMYKKIVREYPNTRRGFEIPVYIAQYYKTNYQPDKMLAAYQEAIGHYKAVTEKYPNSPTGFTAYNMIAQCYATLKDWQGAITTLNTIISNYKGKARLDGIMMNLALIYGREIKDKAKAKEILGQLIVEYPGSKLIKAAKILSKELDKNE